ncbi:hypothetical protein [Solilutibacter tolerans]|uniref:Uncharacterized protein n=1 Tax=Solilutibacter tolerans TaxID=1604334 RepID=A0A1N6RUM6_9GAMM|nr:hypothetical protein [Lysobacter tolerans]SIQ32422.1 hypothetical protein SAMN05421546_1097 [Lysobacter tolerans]
MFAAISLAPITQGITPLGHVVTAAAGAILMPPAFRLAITTLICGLDLHRQQRLDDADACALRH